MKPIFSEVIKIKDGIFCNLDAHYKRMNETSLYFFGKKSEIRLDNNIIPSHLLNGVVKCRLEFADYLIGIKFTPYEYRNIISMALVYDDLIEYSYKLVDRRPLTKLLTDSNTDEIIVIKQNFVTDSSMSNLVFQDEAGLYVSSHYLLNGTKRQYLLQHGLITERVIRVEDILKYSKIYLINAMIDIEDNVSFPTKDIKVF